MMVPIIPAIALLKALEQKVESSSAKHEAWLHVRHGESIKHLPTDRGGECVSNKILRYLRMRGAMCQLAETAVSSSNSGRDS